MVKMGYVWDRTVEVLGEHLGKLLPVAIVAIVLPGVVTGSLADVPATAPAALRMLLGLLGVAAGILSLWAQLAIAAIAIDPARTAGAAVRVAGTRLLPAIGVYLLVGIAFALLASPAIVLIAISGIDLHAAQAGQVAVTAASAGYLSAAGFYGLVTMVAGLFLGGRLAPLTAVIVAERRGAGAIGRAFRLTRGLTWRLAGVILLYLIVLLVASMAVRTVFGSILRLFESASGPITMTTVVTAIAASAVSTAFTVLAAAFCARLYVALQPAQATVQPDDARP